MRPREGMDDACHSAPALRARLRRRGVNGATQQVFHRAGVRMMIRCARGLRGMDARRESGHGERRFRSPGETRERRSGC